MDGILRFNGAVKRDPAIDTWLSRQPGELGSLAWQWFNVMRECGRDVRELIADGFPTACIGDAAFASVSVFKNHVNVGFFYGAGLGDPQQLLEGSGKRMRHVKLRPGVAIDVTALRTLIALAYADIKARLEVA